MALIAKGQAFSRFQIAPKAHTHLLLPMIREVLAQAQLTLQDLTAIAVGRGPGSFTGVRIAISMAQGLAYGLDLPVFPVSTLSALALQAKEQIATGVIIPALDARMSEIYVAVDGDEKVCSPEILKEYSENVIAIGSGWDAYYHLIEHPPMAYLAQCHPQAIHIAKIALQQISQGLPGQKAQAVVPVYLRDKVAEKSVAKILS